MFTGRFVVLVATHFLVQTYGQQEGHEARCGPFFDWKACPEMNDEPQCCSKWGYCSETGTRTAVCAQQDIGDFFWNPPALCRTDADCRSGTNPGPFICSQDVDTKGACALKGFHDQFNGTNPFGVAITPSPAPVKTDAPAQVQNKDSAPNSPSQDQQATSSSISSSQTSVIMTVALIMAVLVLMSN